MDLEKFRHDVHREISQLVSGYEKEIVNLRSSLENSEQKRKSLYESFTQQNESLAAYEKLYGPLPTQSGFVPLPNQTITLPPAAPVAPGNWRAGSGNPGQVAPQVPQAPMAPPMPGGAQAPTQDWRYHPDRLTAGELGRMKLKTSEGLHKVFEFDVAEFVFAVLFPK